MDACRFRCRAFFGLIAASKAPEEVRWIFQFIAFCVAAAAAFGVSVATGSFSVSSG